MKCGCCECCWTSANVSPPCECTSSLLFVLLRLSAPSCVSWYNVPDDDDVVEYAMSCETFVVAVAGMGCGGNATPLDCMPDCALYEEPICTDATPCSAVPLYDELT